MKRKILKAAKKKKKDYASNRLRFLAGYDIKKRYNYQNPNEMMER